MTVLSMPEPCSKIVVHAPHQILVVNPYTSTLAWTLACPGWAPVSASNTSHPTPPLTPSTSETPL